jgi:hypothetical protein
MDIVVKNYNKLLDNKHKLDIISLSDFLFKRGDNLLRDEFIKGKFLRPEKIKKEDFQTLYTWFFNFDIQSGLSFVGDDFPADYYNEEIITYILKYFDEQFRYKDLMKFFNSELLNELYFKKILINHNPYYLKFMSKDMDDYYELVKIAFRKYSYILLGEPWFPREYIPQLKKDFPEDKEIIEYYLLKENISREVRKLLKEENDMKDNNILDKLSKRNGIDLVSLMTFFSNKGDDYLSALIFNKHYENLTIDKATFEKMYIEWFTGTVDILESDEDSEYFDISGTRVGDYIPQEYYTEKITNDIIFRFGKDHAIRHLLNFNSDIVINIVKDYLLDERYTQLLNYFSEDSIDDENVVKLFNYLIPKNPKLIEYIPYTKDYRFFCEKAVSIDAMSLLRMDQRFITYDIFKKAYLQNKDILNFINGLFYKEYIDMLKNEFPEDFNLQESKNSLLKEENDLVDNDSDENELDIFSLSEFLSSKGDNYLKVLLYTRNYKEIVIDRDTFNKMYIEIFKNFLDRMEDYYDDYLESDRIGDYIPKEYYTEEIIKNLLNKFNIDDCIKYLINQYCENFAPVMQRYMMEMYSSYLITYIKTDIEGYFDLCKNMIKHMSTAIKDVPDTYEKYYELCKFALSTTNNPQLILYITSKYITEELCYIAVSKVPTSYGYLHSKFQTYELLKFAYSKDKEILNTWKFDKDYISRLKNDFPEDKEYIEKNQLKEYISREVRKLLREYYLKKR